MSRYTSVAAWLITTWLVMFNTWTVLLHGSVVESVPVRPCRSPVIKTSATNVAVGCARTEQGEQAFVFSSASELSFIFEAQEITSSRATSISPNGRFIAGVFLEEDVQKAFLMEHGVVQEITIANLDQVLDISDDGHIVGSLTDPARGTSAFRWSDSNET